MQIASLSMDLSKFFQSFLLQLLLEKLIFEISYSVKCPIYDAKIAFLL